MEEKASSLKSLAERKEKNAPSGFISPEDVVKDIKKDIVKVDNPKESVEDTKKDIMTDSEKVTDVLEGTGAIVQEEVPKAPEVPSEVVNKAIDHSSLSDWFEKVKILERRFEELKKLEKNYRAGSSDQEELKTRSLQIKADSLRLQKEIKDWFDIINLSIKKWDSSFIVGSIKKPEISIKSNLDFISQKK